MNFNYISLVIPRPSGDGCLLSNLMLCFVVPLRVDTVI